MRLYALQHEPTERPPHSRRPCENCKARRARRTGSIVGVLKNPSYHFKRIGLEAGPLSQWLYSAPNQVLHQPLGGPPIPFLVVARRIPGYSRRGDAKAGHRRVTMFYRILRRILRKHALYHLLIPLFAGLLVEAGYTYLFDNAEWQNLFIHLGSGPRIRAVSRHCPRLPDRSRYLDPTRN